MTLPENLNLEQRVAFLNRLRKIVGRRCPRNKVGTPVVSDFDLIWSTPGEREEALREVQRQ